MTFDPNDPLVQAHIASKELLITTIPDEWHATLRAQLLDGMAQGESVAELQKRVSSVYEGIYDWQAQRIAQTEVIGAENVGTWAAMQEAEVERKSWLATLDNRVRDSHAACHAEGAIPVADPFSNGLMHPGASGPAAEVVNCRCSLAAEVE
jgi:SPP1 gp7 family putative phage head morphogenesis protein